MRAMFCRSNTVGSWLIRTLTWSRWSHVAIVFDDDTVIEALWPRVRKTTLAVAMRDYSEVMLVPFDVPDEAAARAAAEAQVGKPYDLRALLSFLTHRNWEDEGKWFCSELFTWVAAQGKLLLFRKDSSYRISPGHLWMLPETESYGAEE